MKRRGFHEEWIKWARRCITTHDITCTVIYPEWLYSCLRKATLQKSSRVCASKPKIHDGLCIMDDSLHQTCPLLKNGLIAVQPDGPENCKHPFPLCCLSGSTMLYCRLESLCRHDFGTRDILGGPNCPSPQALKKICLQSSSFLVHRMHSAEASWYHCK